MSRTYSIFVRITSFNENKIDQIINATSEFELEHWHNFDNIITLSADINLCAGMRDGEFARELATAIIKANGNDCEVEVNLADLSDLPYETYTFSSIDEDIDDVT